MKLAEALKKRKLLVGELQRLEERTIKASTYKVDENDKQMRRDYSDEDFKDMLSRCKEKRDEILKIKNVITQANTTQDSSGVSVQSLILLRGEKKAE